MLWEAAIYLGRWPMINIIIILLLFLFLIILDLQAVGGCHGPGQPEHVVLLAILHHSGWLTSTGCRQGVSSHFPFLPTVFIIWTGVQSRLQLARTIGSIFTAGEGHRDGGNKVRFKKTTWTKQTSEFLSAKENCTWSRKLPLSQNHSSVFTGLPS